MKSLPSWKKRNLDRVTDGNRDAVPDYALDDNMAVWPLGNTTEYKNNAYKNSGFMKSLQGDDTKKNGQLEVPGFITHKIPLTPSNALKQKLNTNDLLIIPASGSTTDYRKSNNQYHPYNMQKLKNESQWKQRKDINKENWDYEKNQNNIKWNNGKIPASGNATEYKKTKVEIKGPLPFRKRNKNAGPLPLLDDSFYTTKTYKRSVAIPKKK